MKTAVIYSTKTGHSKKIAQAVAAELGVQAADIKESPDISGADLLFVVGGIYGGKGAPEFVEYVKGINAGKVKKAVLITSCASMKQKQTDVREALEQGGVEVLTEELICGGNFLFLRMGHPNKTDIQSAVSFAKNVVEAAK